MLVSKVALAAFSVAMAFSAAATEKTLVELFTSQSCYSCPPAEAYLGELASRADLVALEFHVDYWDDLVYGAAGRWKDVFSRPAYSDRQRAYNRRIRGTSGVYTPQMIVDGRYQGIGARRQAVERAIRQAAEDGHPRLEVAVSLERGRLVVQVLGSHSEPATLWLARFQRLDTTEVTAGENKGKILTNHHVVSGLRALARWEGAPLRVAVADLVLRPEEGCAAFVQAEQTGPILGAAQCPQAEPQAASG